MNSWEDEAKFVLKELQRDDEILFRGEDSAALRLENEKFVRTWGFSENDMWDLDKAIAMFILPRLAYFCRNKICVPSLLEKRMSSDGEVSDEDVEKEWTRILETICDGLHLYIEKDNVDISEEEQRLWEEAKRYLFDYFECLWF